MEWFSGLSLDDQLWHQAMVVDFNQEETWRTSIAMNNCGFNAQMLFHLINRRVIDHSDEDKAWDGST